MNREQRLKRMDELRRELIDLEIIDKYEEGFLGNSIKEKDLPNIAAIAYILLGESSNPIEAAVEIHEGFSKLTEAGKIKLKKELAK